MAVMPEHPGKAGHVTASNDRELVELDDRWLLPYRGLTVTRICVDYALTLSLGADAQISIESTAILSKGPATAPLAPPITLEPQHQDVGPALMLFGTRVLSRVAFKKGTLRLVLGSHHLSVRPHPDFEAWQATGPGDLRIVCMPGGQLAVWQLTPAGTGPDHHAALPNSALLRSSAAPLRSAAWRAPRHALA